MMDSQNSKGAWREWANYILLTLEKSDRRLTKIEDKVDNLEMQLKILITKITLIVSLVSALITCLSYFIIEWFKSIL